MSFLRKHSVPLALLAVLAAAVAAPYCLPENPDSPVFRSGVLGALLLAGCFFPVRQALERCSRRELACGLGWGLLFAAALSLGSELLVYDGLLRGLGSAIRRAAVPALAAPLLGCVCARALLCAGAPAKARRIPAPAFALILFLCWLPVLLACFPGLLNYDFDSEYRQYPDSVYKTPHPLLYSVLQRALLDLGARIANPTVGLLLTTLARMAVLALALGYGCAFAARRGASPLALAGLTAFFALHPVFSVMAVSTNKDVPFTAALLTLTLIAWEALEEPEAFWRSKGRVAGFALMAVLTAHLRKNGVFALIPLFPALVAAQRGRRGRMTALCALSAACCALLAAGLYAWLKPLAQNEAHLFSVPAQQLVRAYNAGTMSEEDRAELEAWYVFPSGLNLYPHIADRAKNNLDHERFDADSSDYFALWARVGRTHVHEYTEAFLLLNMGLWYPDDLTHASVYDPIAYDAPGYLQTDLYDPEAYGIEPASFLPGLRARIESLCAQNGYQRLPILPLLFCTATPFWALLLAAARMIAGRRTRALPAVSGVLGVWASYFLGACTLPRYVLPLFGLAPVLLAVAFAGKGKGDAA